MLRGAPMNPHRASVHRAVACFFGVFTLWNLVGAWLHPGFDPNLWWIDLRWLPAPLARALLLAAGVALTAQSLRPVALPEVSPARRRVTRALTAALCLAAFANAVTVVVLHATGRLHAGVPLSLPLAALLAWQLRAQRTVAGAASPAVIALTLAALGVVFPLAQMVTYGRADYRRPADAIVVFGARAYADGTASQALRDRVLTACALYRAGLARTVIFSGGPGDGALDEPAVMTRLATAHGVPASAIVRDSAGLDTRATARNTAAILRARGLRTTLAVSHFYHLPRVKMTFQREGIAGVYTVPAYEPRPLTLLPYYMLREVAGFWVYYLRDVLSLR